MSRLKLYGDSRSGNCYKAAWLMKMAEIPFEWVETDILKGKSRTPEFMALNPNGRVPLLVWPDGRCLAESNAMLLHLSRNTDYFPADEWQQALTWQWLFFEQYSHEPYIAVTRFIVAVARREVEESERLIGLRQKGHEALSVMEGVLEKDHYMTGAEFTIADMALYAYTHEAGNVGFNMAAYPAVMAWLERIAQRPDHVNMAQACC